MMGKAIERSNTPPPLVLASFATLLWLVIVGPPPRHHRSPSPPLLLPAAHGHGYLSSPRSRNLLAFQETVWWPQTENDPEPETCPHCLNRGGSRARCGLFETSGNKGRNYDAPRNALGGSMPPKVQAEYVQGQNVVLDVTLTAHHKGHFVFSACPISPGEIPTQECFDRHRLTFLSDLLHGANYDPNHPERAYIAPVDDPGYVPDPGSTRGVMEYSFNMLLPPDLHGDLVLIQWYYLTANSCYHEGYQEYEWPAGWNIDATSSGLCGDVSSDGIGVPEQFWNCAEVRILAAEDDPAPPSTDQAANPVPPPPTKEPTRKPSLAEISSGIAIPVNLPSSQQQSAGSGSPPSSAGSHGKTIVGYYASWQWYDRNKKAAPENMDFTKVQRVNFAFFQIDAQGNMWGTDAWADPNLLFGPYNWNPSEGSKQYCSWDSATIKKCNYHNYEQGLIHLVHAAGAEIYPSLGGWTLSDAFPAMAANMGARARFAQNCVDLIVEYGFDGIDIDWEYPGYEDHSGTPQDRENFKLLLNDVRAKLDALGMQTGKFYGLTAALPCGPRHIANMDIAHVASTLSELNLMTYDFHGAFSATSGINAPMYYQGWGEEDFDVHSCVQNWLAGGGSRDKINIGLPFYGRSVGVATGLDQPHNGADKSVWGIDDGTPQYFNIVAKLTSMKTVWDKKTWTPYAYFDGGGFVSFDDENSICVKVQYAIENSLGGFIIWELSGDLMEDLSTPLLDVTNEKLHNPDLNCGEPGIYPEDAELSVPAAPTTSLVGQGSTPTPTKSPGSPGSETPGTFPTPSAQNIFNPISSLDPSEPAEESLYGETVDEKPLGQPLNEQVNDQLMSGQQVTGQSVTDHLLNQPISDTSTNNKPLDYQPVNPMNNRTANQLIGQPIYGKSKLFLCGDQQGSNNIDGSKSLDLSFRYEVHTVLVAPISYVVEEVKDALLGGLAEKLNCAAASSVTRRLRSNRVEASQENVIAIESMQFLPEKDTPCLIPVNLDIYTVCHSVIGSMTAHFEGGTSAAVLSEVSEELLFYIRTSMASGKFESASIRKVIFIEDLSTSPGVSSTEPSNTYIRSEHQNDGGANSLVVAIVFCLLVVLLSAFTAFVFATSKRRSEARYAEDRENTTESKPNDSVPLTMPTLNSTEEAWKRALNTDKVCRNAMNAYGDKSAKFPVDLVEEETPDPEVCRRAIPVEPIVERKVQKLGKGDKGPDQLSRHDKLEGQSEFHEGYYRNVKSNQVESQEKKSDEGAVVKGKKRSRKKSKRSFVQHERMALGPDEGVQSSDSTMENGQNHCFDAHQEVNANDGDGSSEPIDDDSINVTACNEEEKTRVDDPSLFRNNSEGKLDTASVSDNDEKVDRLPSGKKEDESDDSKYVVVGKNANSTSSPSLKNIERGTAGSGEGSKMHGELSGDEDDLD